MISSYDEAVAYLEAHIGRGMHPGLERINGLLDLMGRPDQAIPIVHVAGTNGKTSTTRMTTMLLVAHGLTTGTFISPHLERIEERFSLNGFIATPEQFVTGGRRTWRSSPTSTSSGFAAAHLLRADGGHRVRVVRRPGSRRRRHRGGAGGTPRRHQRLLGSGGSPDRGRARTSPSIWATRSS
jgi:hypothetical protein